MANATPRGDDADRIVGALTRSQLFIDYAKAFSDSFGIPLQLQAPELVNGRREPIYQCAKFCPLLALTGQSCPACRELLQCLEYEAKPRTGRCFTGLLISAVPILVGDDLRCYLWTGGVHVREPSRALFVAIRRKLQEFGAPFEVKRVQRAYFSAPVVTRAVYGAALRLLAAFAQHLASVSNQLMLSNRRLDSPIIVRAKLFLHEHACDDIRISQVAQWTHTSISQFCRTFKKETGFTCTDYLARLRIERAKTFLSNPHMRISEAAFAAGFQCLSQFNRAFRRVAGISPSDLRKGFTLDSPAKRRSNITRPRFPKPWPSVVPTHRRSPNYRSLAEPESVHAMPDSGLSSFR